jgi:hypothetical protein
MSLDDGDSVRYWTALMDAEVSHKTLMALIYCLLERTKQVSKNIKVFFVLYHCIQVFIISMGRRLAKS